MLKKQMHRYFTAKRTRRYINVLANLIHSYKDTRHRCIGMAPMEVTAKQRGRRARTTVPPKPKTLIWDFNVGEKVCISMQRRPFKKGYVGNWS